MVGSTTAVSFEDGKHRGYGLFCPLLSSPLSLAARATLGVLTINSMSWQSISDCKENFPKSMESGVCELLNQLWLGRSCLGKRTEWSVGIVVKPSKLSIQRQPNPRKSAKKKSVIRHYVLLYPFFFMLSTLVFWLALELRRSSVAMLFSIQFLHFSNPKDIGNRIHANLLCLSQYSLSYTGLFTGLVGSG